LVLFYAILLNLQEVRPMWMFPSQAIKRASQTGFATVEEAIAPEHTGRVAFHATSWPAKFAPEHTFSSDHPIVVFPGDRVQVVGIEGITLIVIPTVAIAPILMPNIVISPCNSQN
jgi:membrane protein implicated in regulation of membrane protease activity